MSTLSHNILEAVDHLVDRKIDATPIDQTITAKVVLLRNIEVGEYKVAHKGETFSAYSLDPLTVYKKGQEVYVVVPRGDYSAKKIILGPAIVGDKISQSDRAAMQNQWRTRGPNWLSQEWYWKNPDGTPRTDAREGGIVVSAEEDIADISTPGAWREYLFYAGDPVVFEEVGRTASKDAATVIAPEAGGLEQVNKELQLWGSQLEHIMVKAKFETQFLDTHSSGQYGVRIQCYTEDPNDSSAKRVMTYDLTFGSFNGAPYSFAQPTLQTAVFSVPKGTLKGLLGVSLFQTDGWRTDVRPAVVNAAGQPDEKGTNFTFQVPPATKILNQNNVHATDVEIYWCEPVNLKDRLFWLKLETPKGNAFVKEGNQSNKWITSLPLRARLMYGGEDITSPETCKFTWFRRRPSWLKSNAAGTKVDEFGNTWAHYLPEAENGWVPVSLLNGAGTEAGESAKYKLGTLRDTVFVEQDNFTDAILVDTADVPWQWEYMAVCYYNPNGGKLEEIQRNKVNDALIWEKETLRNLSSLHDFELPKAFLGLDLKTFYLRVRDNNLPWAEGPYNLDQPEMPDPERDWWCRWWALSGLNYRALESPAGLPFPRYIKGRRELGDVFLNEPIKITAEIYGKRNPVGGTREGKIADAAQLWKEPRSLPDQGAEYPQHLLGVVDITLVPDNSPLVHVDFEGQTAHYYNSDGKIRLPELAEKQFSIIPKITLKNDSVTIFSVEWLAPDRTPLSQLYPEQIEKGEGYQMEKVSSMLRSMWSNVPNSNDTKRALHYKVKDTYDINLVTPENNTFWFRIQFLNGKVQEVPLEITYIKADSNGAQGSEWTAVIAPTNARADQTVDGTLFTRNLLGQVTPLVVSGQGRQIEGEYFSVEDLVLRPFVKRNGIEITRGPEASKYYYKVFWDCSYPGLKECTSDPRGAVKGKSFLEFSKEWISGDSEANGGSDGQTAYAGAGKYKTYTDSRTKLADGYTETYGAIAVKWAGEAVDGRVNGASFIDINYSFFVKARVEIFFNGKKVATVNSFYGVDTLFLGQAKKNEINPKLIFTNWPRQVQYSPTGISPLFSNDSLKFYYGDRAHRLGERQPRLYNMQAQNLTPKTQEIRKYDASAVDRGAWHGGAYQVNDGETLVVGHNGRLYYAKQSRIPSDEEPRPDSKYWGIYKGEFNQKLYPRPFYFFEEMDNGALTPDLGMSSAEWPAGTSQHPDFALWISKGVFFVRPIIYYMSQYGNDTINGWDGKSIDINEEGGSILAPTIGAGWKHPFLNTFSGVVMGIDKSQLRKAYEPGYGGFSADTIEQSPYMTGLFGYQDGYNSFGIMENGTAFFGRADRGGRIIIDGYNAQIYGGVMTERNTGLDADMRNRMRLSFIDFGGLNNGVNIDSPSIDGNADLYRQKSRDYDQYYATIDWKQYRCNAAYRKQVDAKLKELRNAMKAVPNSPTPGQEVGKNPSVALASFPLNRTIDPGATPARDRWFGDFHSYFAPGKGLQDHPTAARFAGYYSGASYSTPAIEIGSYEDWVRDKQGRRIPYTAAERAFLDEGDNYQYHRGSDLIRHYTIDQIKQQSTFNNINSLEIPGFRKFLVTYDGTLYAMNAFIKGNIVGSNIIGSQFFNADATFAVTKDGNLGIGKGVGDWLKEVVQSGYSIAWSARVPQVEQVNISTYLPTTKNQRSDFLKGDGFAFYVSNEGKVVCQDIHIGGGSIDIGNFHVIGESGGGYEGGDVVSFGTMYLVGRKHSAPGPGVSALEVWGDIHARGRLANLGQVLLGGSWEKNRNTTSWNATTGMQGMTVPTTFNSPFSITPSLGAAGSVTSKSTFPVRGAMWPLYFNCGAEPGTGAGVNNYWVSFSTSATGSSYTNYMPAFSNRAVKKFASSGFSCTLADKLTWRVDQIGNWTDGMILTNSDWVSGIDDGRPMNIENHGLAFIGWGTTGWRNPIPTLTITNLSRKAPHLIFRTPSVAKLTAESDLKNIARGPGSLPGASTPKVILRADPGGSTGVATVVLSGHGESSKDNVFVQGGSVFLSATGRGAPVEGIANLEAFIALNAIKLDAPIHIKDENDSIIGATPAYVKSVIWAKAAGVAIDGASKQQHGTAAVNDSTGQNLSTLRLNRQWDGATSAGMPSNHTSGENFAGLSAGTVMLRSRANVAGAPGATDTIHIVNGGTDNSSDNQEIYMARNGSQGQMRLTALSELTLGLSAAGHSKPTTGLIMTKDRFELAGYAPDKQFKIYARFG